MKKLGEVCDCKIGLTYRPTDVSENGIIVLRSSNIQNNHIDLSDIVRVNMNLDIKSSFIAQKGDILMCSRNGSKHLVGKVAKIDDFEEPLSFGAFMTLIRSKYNNFLYYFFLSQSFKKQIAVGNNAMINQITKSILNNILLFIPPLPEQHRIVSELDCLSGIIEKKREQLKELDNLAQAVFYEMFGDPVRNGKGWEVVKIGEVCEIISGSTPKTNVEKYWNGPHFGVTPAEIDKKWIAYTKRTITDEGVNSAHLQLLPVGTVLLSSRAPIGKVAITKVPMYCNQGFKNLVCSERLHNEYLYTYLKLNTDFLISLGVGATFKEISRTIVSSIRIPVPPFSLQQQFADRISAIDRQKTLIQQSLSEVENLFHSRMDNYFG